MESTLLAELFKSYDRRIRPNHGSDPTIVETTLDYFILLTMVSKAKPSREKTTNSQAQQEEYIRFGADIRLVRRL